MTTTTFSETCAATGWTLLAAGSTVASVTLQTLSTTPCQIAVAANTDAIAGFVYLSLLGDRSLTLDLDAADNVYGRANWDTVTIHGYKVAR
jgi:hypothetical protein